MQKKNKSDSATDIITWNIPHKDGGNFPSSGLPCKVFEKEYFSTKQKEMDMQLQTLQNIVENMEQDFRNSKIVSTNCWFLSSLFFQLKTKPMFWINVFSNLLSIC